MYIVYYHANFSWNLMLSVMADPLEHATGLERKELEAIKRGNDVRKELLYNVCI